MPIPLIVDTDAGFDDFLAVAWLLANPQIQIEAFTLVNGISDVDEGAAALLLLQERAGIPKPIPVYKGSRHPLAGANHFPDPWRHQATQIIDRLGWGTPTGEAQPEGAVAYLTRRLRDATAPLEILAIGPLTNMAHALAHDPTHAISRMTIMGGAVGVPGNIPPAHAAEGNIYVDPAAAQRVLSSNAFPTVVPLNATAHVPLTRAFIESFHARGSLGLIAQQILTIIEAEFLGPTQPPYDAWDPLAGVAVGHGAVLQHVEAMALAVTANGVEAGQTVKVDGVANCQVALSADAAAFRSVYARVFAG